MITTIPSQLHLKLHLQLLPPGPNNLAMFQPHYTSKKAGSLVGLADKLVLYYNSKASKDHVVLDLVYGKVPTERLDGRLTGHSLSTWNVKASPITFCYAIVGIVSFCSPNYYIPSQFPALITNPLSIHLTPPNLQDILSCVGGVQLIFPLLEAICTSSSRFEGQLLSPTSRTEMRPAFLRSHYTSDVSVGIHEGKVVLGTAVFPQFFQCFQTLDFRVNSLVSN
eukprot:sb/3469746/